jgi:Protein of unknown function (DUF3499)
VATLSYAYSDGIVWLEELSPEAHPMVHDLCRLHAANVRVPLGWELRDQWSQVAERADAAPAEQASLDLIGA